VSAYVQPQVINFSSATHTGDSIELRKRAGIASTNRRAAFLIIVKSEREEDTEMLTGVGEQRGGFQIPRSLAWT
jgi:hypothetical protein